MISINDFHVTYTPGSGYSAKFKDGTAPNVSICWGEEYVKKLKENLNKPAAGGNDPSFERAELTEEELASLAEKFDPHKMTQKEYDEFLETLVDKNVITKQEMQRAGYKGLVVVNSWSDMCYGQLTHRNVCRADIRHEKQHPSFWRRRNGRRCTVVEQRDEPEISWRKGRRRRIPCAAQYSQQHG